MLSSIYYFVEKDGTVPVKIFIKSLPVKERAKVFAYLMELKNQGHNLRRPMADYLKDGIYELRPKDNRILYFFFVKDTAVLVHALRKKTDRIPEGDLNLCVKRKALVEEYRRVEKME
jgi:phage-related protein